MKVGDNASGKTTDVVSLKDLNTVLKSGSKDTLAALNVINWKNANQFYFLIKKES